jgi:hypothetical protein
MRKKICGAAVFLMLAGVAFAPAALADPGAGHGSCAALFTGVLVPMAQSGQVGQTASADAPLNDIIHQYQAAYCDPRP